ncbi:hypothetical protein [Catalinimonas alkaloidigena]|nr:hypothetical protein [Catalinimonas alkaloidigena]
MNATTRLTRFRNQWRAYQMGEVGLYALGLAGLLLTIIMQLMGWSLSWFWVLPLTALLFVIGLIIRRGLRLSPHEIARYLNQRYPTLESSAELLLQPDEHLPLLARLQRERVATRLSTLEHDLRPPHRLGRAGGVFALLVGLALAVWFLVPLLRSAQDTPPSATSGTASVLSPPTPAVVLPPELDSLQVVVTPPAYTGQRPYVARQLHVQAPEGSRIAVQAIFTAPVTQAQVILSGRDTLLLTTQDSVRFQTRFSLQENGFYQLCFQTNAPTSTCTDFYRLEAQPDQPPEVTLADVPAWQQLDFEALTPLSVTAQVQDDYGLKDAYLIATVSKGSGESVKFREEKLPFQEAVRGRQQRLHRTLDLRQLGMAPGDELYFYAEVWDNRAPQPQKSRTETYFVVIRDTTTQTISVEGGVAVDLMPAYFRSQRQLIIDTEKLIKEKPRLSSEAFQTRSNDLAHDQKVLRLRYGQFMGEEFESSLEGGGPGEGHEHAGEASPDPTQAAAEEFGHVHDNEDAQDRGVLETHNPAGGATTTLNNGAEVPEDLVHAHDSEEEATFIFDATKTKLRRALSLMWTSELHLRLNEPRQALPVEYEILELLKDIQQQNRIYVERVGFEPPPIKEAEKRLTGELDEVASRQRTETLTQPPASPHLRRSVALLETLKLRPPTEAEQQVLQAAGGELAELLRERPDAARFLPALQTLKALSEGNRLPRPELGVLQQALATALPNTAQSPTARPTAQNKINTLYIRELQRLTSPNE